MAVVLVAAEEAVDSVVRIWLYSRCLTELQNARLLTMWRAGRGGGGGYGQRDFGPPATVLEMGQFIHACEGEMVCESINPKIPHFNAPIYLENKVCFAALSRVPTTTSLDY